MCADNIAFKVLYVLCRVQLCEADSPCLQHIAGVPTELQEENERLGAAISVSL